jgi:hypothetical protein
MNGLEDDVGQLRRLGHELPEDRTGHPVDHAAGGHTRREQGGLPGQHVQLAQKRAWPEDRHDLLRQSERREPHDFQIAGLDQHEVKVDIPSVGHGRARGDDRLRGTLADDVQMRRREVRISARDPRRRHGRRLGVRSLHTHWHTIAFGPFPVPTG